MSSYERVISFLRELGALRQDDPGSGQASESRWRLGADILLVRQMPDQTISVSVHLVQSAASDTVMDAIANYRSRRFQARPEPPGYPR